MPYKFYPKYRLFRLYRENGDIIQCMNVANTILSMPVKIYSRDIDDIKSEMKVFIETYKNGRLKGNELGNE